MKTANCLKSRKIRGEDATTCLILLLFEYYKEIVQKSTNLRLPGASHDVPHPDHALLPHLSALELARRLPELHARGQRASPDVETRSFSASGLVGRFRRVVGC